MKKIIILSFFVFSVLCLEPKANNDINKLKYQNSVLKFKQLNKNESGIIYVDNQGNIYSSEVEPQEAVPELSISRDNGNTFNKALYNNKPIRGVKSVFEDSNNNIWVEKLVDSNVDSDPKNACGLYLSKDYGKTFTQISFFNNNIVNNVYEDSENKLWISTGGGLFISNDFGSTFQQIKNYPIVHHDEIENAFIQVIQAKKDVYFARSAYDIFKSTDNGVSFHIFSNNTKDFKYGGLFLDNLHRLWTNTKIGIGHGIDDNSRFYDIPDLIAMQMTSFSEVNNIKYLGTYMGLLYSQDNILFKPVDFSQIGLQNPPTNSQAYNGKLYVATNSGIYIGSL